MCAAVIVLAKGTAANCPTFANYTVPLRKLTQITNRKMAFVKI